MIKIVKLSRLGIGALLLTTAWPAHALDMEYYTYDGFDDVVSSLQRLALIFSDNSYLGLFAAMAVFGMVFSWMSTAGRGILGAKVHPFAWAGPILAGMVVFKALVIPTGTLWVYDPVRNQNQAVGGVPDLIVATAGIFNLIQRGLVDIVDTASAYPYANEAGGIRFDLIYRATSEPLNADDSYLSKSVSQFVSDCLPVALAQPGFAIDLNVLKHQAGDLKDAIGAAQNDAVYTTWYDAANKSGTSMTCKDAWVNKLNPILSDDATFASMIKGVCGKAGFNVNDPQQMAQCQVLLDDVAANNHDIAGGTAALYIRNVFLTQQITRAMENSDPDLAQNMIANRNMMLGGFGAAQAANQWIPHAMSIATAAAFAIIPISLLFIVTPLFMRALTAAFSMLIGIAVWGVTDAVMHQAAMDGAQNAYDKIKAMKLGIDAILLSPDAALQSLAYFGHARSFGFALAAFVMGTVFVMSNKALSSPGGMLSNAESTGSAAEKQVSASEERAMLLDGLSNSRAWDSAIAGPGFGGVAQAAGFDRNRHAHEIAEALKLGSRSGMTRADMEHAQGMLSAGTPFGQLMAMQQGARESGMSLAQYSSEVSHAENAQRIGNSKGFEQAMLKMGGWDGKSPVSENDRASMMHAGAVKYASIEAMRHYSETSTMSNMKDQLMAEYETANPGKTLTDTQAWGQVAKMGFAEQWSSIDASHGDPNAMIQFMERNKSLGMSRMQGLFEQAAAFGITPGQLASVDGQMEAARQTGDYRALQKMSTNEVAAAYMTDRLYSGERSDALQGLADGYFKGDVKSLLSAVTNTEAAANLGQYLAMSKIASTLGKDMTSTFQAKDMAGVTMSLTPQDVKRHEKALAAVMSPEQLQDLKQHGGKFELTYNPHNSQITYANATAGADTRVAQHRTEDTSTIKASGHEWRGGFGNTSEGALQEALAGNHGLLRDMMANVVGSPANEALFLNSVASRYEHLASSRNSFNEGEGEHSVTGDRTSRGWSAGGGVGGGVGTPKMANSPAHGGLRGNAGYEISDSHYESHEISSTQGKNNELHFNVIRGNIGNGWDQMKHDAAIEARAIAGHDEDKYNQLYIDRLTDKFKKADQEFYATINNMSEGQAYQTDANLGKPFYSGK